MPSTDGCLCERVCASGCKKRIAHLEKVDVWMAKESREELDKSSGRKEIMHSESEQNEVEVGIK